LAYRGIFVSETVVTRRRFLAPFDQLHEIDMKSLLPNGDSGQRGAPGAAAAGIGSGHG
jgi:hypothetical protein